MGNGGVGMACLFMNIALYLCNFAEYGDFQDCKIPNSYGRLVGGKRRAQKGKRTAGILIMQSFTLFPSDQSNAVTVTVLLALKSITSTE